MLVISGPPVARPRAAGTDAGTRLEPAPRGRRRCNGKTLIDSAGREIEFRLSISGYLGSGYGRCRSDLVAGAANQRATLGQPRVETVPASPLDYRLPDVPARSEEHTSELQSRFDLVC